MSAEALTLRDLGRVEVVEAVERLGGIQAQEPRPPFGALWTRLQAFQRADLQAALQARAVLRATLMRATLHLVSAADYPVRLHLPLVMVPTDDRFGFPASPRSSSRRAWAGCGSTPRPTVVRWCAATWARSGRPRRRTCRPGPGSRA